MRYALALVPALLGAALAAAEQPVGKPLAAGLKHPVAVAVGLGGKIFVLSRGDDGKEGDGAIMVIDNGKAAPFVTGLLDPQSMVAFNQWLFVVDQNRVCRVDGKGKLEVMAQLTDAPSAPDGLKGLAVDRESGVLYVSRSGDAEGHGAAVYRLPPRGKLSLLADAGKIPELMKRPVELVMDGASHLVVGAAGGELFRIRLADGSVEKLASDGMPGHGGLAWDYHGRLFMSDRVSGLHVRPRPGDKPVSLAGGLNAPRGICLGPTGRDILVTSWQEGTLSSVPIVIPGREVDETPLPLHTEIAFPNLEWTGWKGETDTGKVNPLRPILLTHAGDGSGRVFVATEHGVIHSFPNDQKATRTTVFLDIQDRVSYRDDQNEEGFLGLAFHPKFKDNGEFFVFYTTRKAKLTNVVSRFRVRTDDPTRADPASEEEILRFTKPFWNHDGGTILFGPDGYLYVTHGDGGAANDPYENGQNLKSLLGKVHRIDVDRKEEGRNYAIPKDNPFAGRPDARGEIWAYGLRNIWRMSFDRKTGQLWAGDVGQNLFEEIDIIRKGGNYGWNRREGLHPFGAKGSGPRPEFIDPLWEYHHDVGKSITGGHVYRGARHPELDGMYLYADYVSGKIWALTYDEAKGRVVANRPIKDRNIPIFSFGEDDRGEVYLLTSTPTGKVIYWLAK